MKRINNEDLMSLRLDQESQSFAPRFRCFFIETEPAETGSGRAHEYVAQLSRADRVDEQLAKSWMSR
jgi:hypothetical protein